MILKDSTSYWATGMTLTWDEYHQAWTAKVEFYDDGWIGDDDPDAGLVSTEGTLRTRYSVDDGETVTALTAVIDAMLADGAGLDVAFRGTLDREPWLFCSDVDEDDDTFPGLPGWRELLTEQAKRIGWRTYGYEPTTYHWTMWSDTEPREVHGMVSGFDLNTENAAYNRFAETPSELARFKACFPLELCDQARLDALNDWDLKAEAEKRMLRPGAKAGA